MRIECAYSHILTLELWIGSPFLPVQLCFTDHSIYYGIKTGLGGKEFTIHSFIAALQLCDDPALVNDPFLPERLGGIKIKQRNRGSRCSAVSFAFSHVGAESTGSPAASQERCGTPTWERFDLLKVKVNGVDDEKAAGSTGAGGRMSIDFFVNVF